MSNLGYFRPIIRRGHNLEFQGGDTMGDKVRVVIGTHPIPEKYRLIHEKLGTWKAAEWVPRLKARISDEETRVAYD